MHFAHPLGLQKVEEAKGIVRATAALIVLLVAHLPSGVLRLWGLKSMLPLFCIAGVELIQVHESGLQPVQRCEGTFCHLKGGVVEKLGRIWRSSTRGGQAWQLSIHLG